MAADLTAEPVNEVHPTTQILYASEAGDYHRLDPDIEQFATQ